MPSKLALLKGKYKHLSSAKAIEKELEFEGHTVLPWEDRQGATYSQHSHPHDEYIVVSSGEITFIIDNKDWLLGAGDALILPANTSHSAINKGDSAVKYFICT